MDIYNVGINAHPDNIQKNVRENKNSILGNTLSYGAMRGRKGRIEILIETMIYIDEEFKKEQKPHEYVETFKKRWGDWCDEMKFNMRGIFDVNLEGSFVLNRNGFVNIYSLPSHIRLYARIRDNENKISLPTDHVPILLENGLTHELSVTTPIDLPRDINILREFQGTAVFFKNVTINGRKLFKYPERNVVNIPRNLTYRSYEFSSIDNDRKMKELAENSMATLASFTRRDNR